MRLLVLGGTRFLGLRVCERMLAAGRPVTLLNRGETGGALDGVELRARRPLARRRPRRARHPPLRRRARPVRLPERLGAALGGRPARPRRPLRASSRAARSTGRSPQLPWAETTPLGPMPRWGAYGDDKVASERLLRAAEAEGAFARQHHRYPFILGPANFVDRESFVLSRLEARRPILLPGGGRSINQFVYVDDAARRPGRRARAARRRRRPGLELRLPRGPHQPRVRRAVRRRAGLAAEIVPIDDEALGVGLAGRRPDRRRLPLPGRPLPARLREARPRAGRGGDGLAAADARGVRRLVGGRARPHAAHLRARAARAGAARIGRRCSPPSSGPRPHQGLSSRMFSNI